MKSANRRRRSTNGMRIKNIDVVLLALAQAHAVGESTSIPRNRICEISGRSDFGGSLTHRSKYHTWFGEPGSQTYALTPEGIEKVKSLKKSDSRPSEAARVQNTDRIHKPITPSAKRQRPKPKKTESFDGHLVEDINGVIENPNIGTTEKVAQILARVGQGDFRKRVLKLWENCCAVTRSKSIEAIRASHIKPWRDSTNDQRLDPDNGLPLVASLDALFDAGLISFESSGKMIVSSKLNEEEQVILGVGNGSLAKKPNQKMAAYLAYHRENYFQK